MQRSKRSQRSLQLILLLGKFQYEQLVIVIKLETSLFRFVEAVLNSVIEKNDKSRVASGGLIAAMLSRGLLGEVRHLLVVVTCSHAQYFAGPVPHSPGHPARVR